MLNNKKEIPDLDRISEEIQKSENRFKLAMIVVLFIISFAAAMIFISIMSSL